MACSRAVAEAVQRGDLVHVASRVVARRVRPRWTRARAACSEQRSRAATVGVVQLLDDPQPDRVAFGGGELGERLAEGGAPLRGVDQLLDALDRGVVQGWDRDRQPPAGAQLHPLASLVGGQLPGGDAVQPGTHRAAAVVVAMAFLVGDGEGLGDQVKGSLGVAGAPVAERQQRLGPAVIQHPEGVRVVVGGTQQLAIGRRVAHRTSSLVGWSIDELHPVYVTTAQDVTHRPRVDTRAAASTSPTSMGAAADGRACPGSGRRP